MTELRELFEAAADSPAPPSRLLADEVYAAGRHRRRRRVAAAAVMSGTALTAITLAAVNLLAPTSTPVDKSPIAGETIPSAEPTARAGQRIQWAGATDADHLYLAVPACTSTPCTKSLSQLVGSDDGGRTWSERGTPMDLARLTVLGRDTLIATGPADRPVSGGTLLTSTDGGRTWGVARPGGPVAAVPEGGTAICWSSAAGEPCHPHAVDPVARLVAPLADPPPLTGYADEPTVEKYDGQLWLAGTDPATGRPAVAVSADAGRTWSTQVFTDAPPCPSMGCAAPSLAVGNGGTAYAVVTGEQARVVYRRTGGPGAAAPGWQRVTGAGDLPYEQADNGSFVTADGTHVFYQLENGRNDVYRFRAARGGGAYRLVELDGLPGSAGPVRRTPDGWYYAPSHADGVLYGSTDGWQWSPVTSR